MLLTHWLHGFTKYEKCFTFSYSGNLTWRDMQHLTVLTSKRNRLFDPYLKHFWQFNGAGLEFNHLFGYGVLDAGDMVKMAKAWKPLPERFHCTAGSIVKDMYVDCLTLISLNVKKPKHLWWLQMFQQKSWWSWKKYNYTTYKLCMSSGVSYDVFVA